MKRSGVTDYILDRKRTGRRKRAERENKQKKKKKKKKKQTLE